MTPQEQQVITNFRATSYEDPNYDEVLINVYNLVDDKPWADDLEEWAMSPCSATHVELVDEIERRLKEEQNERT